MARKCGRVLRVGCFLAGWALLGCGAPAPPPAGEPVQLTPAMETMKSEMFKSYNASKGKGAGKAPGKARASRPAPK